MSIVPNLDEMTDEEKLNVLESVQKSIADSKEIQKQKIAANVDLVVQALKKIESDIRSRFDDVGFAIEKRVSAIKDGRDGADGRDGRNGKDGKNGRDGATGPRGADGKNGIDGADGTDGVSVANAHIDFDGSLVISLSSGQEINVGEVVAPALAEQIKVITNGGGTSQSVIDTLASLQAQITALGSSVVYGGLWNASTNTPTLVSSVGTSGTFYIVSVAGTTSLNGISNWGVGDWAIFNGTVWQRVEGGADGNFTTLSASSTVTFSGLTASTALALDASKNVVSVTNTGSGSNVLATSPTLVTPVLGTPSSGTLTNCTFPTLNQNTSGTAAGLSATLVATSGGTGQSSYAVGDILYASTTTALSKLADVATGNAIISGGIGAAPSYGKIALTTHISGTLPVANGGTNITSYTIGDIVYASTTGVLSSLADVATGSAIISGGIGVAPSYGKIGLTTHVSGTLPVANGGTGITAIGTGVATALGVNVGTAGAFVVNGGALGTPSSGTVTNLTGTASININGTVGATTPSTGAFTTLSATGNITCNGGKYSLQSASTEYGSLSTASGDLTLASAAGGYLKLLSVGNLLLGYAASAEIFRGSSVGVSLTNSLGVGGATPSGGGGGAGITFPATQSASTDANTLDDYEEGTWTPNQGSGLVVVGTFSSVGWYTKIGRIVQVTGTVTGSSSISVSNNSLITSNMPFNVIAVAGPCGSMVNGSTQLGGLVQGGASSGQLYAATTISATANIFFSLTYNV
jgi:hypothetical protein